MQTFAPGSQKRRGAQAGFGRCEIRIHPQAGQLQPGLNHSPAACLPLNFYAMNHLTGSIQTPHHPGQILLAAQERAKQIRRQDETLKREIEWLARLTRLSYEQARQYVLHDRGLLR